MTIRGYNHALVSFKILGLIEGSLEVKLPTIWTDEKQRWEETDKRREEERESLRRKKIQVREQVGKSRNTVFFPMICGSGGSKSRLAKAAGAEPAGQMRDAKVHAVVARSTFPSQNAQSTSAPDRFWKLRCRKSARRCGAKHISKSKCTKLTVRNLGCRSVRFRSASFQISESPKKSQKFMPDCGITKRQ